MDSKQTSQLAQAKDYFYAWKFAECYGLLRRFFDRLPFAPEPQHAEYIGVFCRTLAELGKDFELQFYMKELEKLVDTQKDPYLAYALAVVYEYSNEPRAEMARELFEYIVKSSASEFLKNKARMMLIDYYTGKRDICSMRMIVDSIRPCGDTSVDRLAEIWRAIVERFEGKYAESLQRLNTMIRETKFDDDWYSHFSARLARVTTLIEAKSFDDARGELSEVQAMVAEHSCKSTRKQIEYLERKLAESVKMPSIVFEPGEKQSAFIYADNKIFVSHKTPADKLLLAFLRRGFLSKDEIIRVVYARQYGANDDKLIYYHIHSLRKRIKEAGIPTDAISAEKNGYRLVPEVETVRSEL